jgi:mono/diheme cytochrome c family protein
MRKFALLIPVFLLVACGRGEVVQPTTPTVFVPPRAATATAEAQRAAEATPTSEQAATVEGDASAGEALFNEFQQAASFACVTCHNPDNEERLVGPGLQNIGDRAATRVEGQDAVTYMRNSILHPNDYLVESYPEGLMPQVYGDIFTDEQINDLIAYLLTL